jgi:non-heme chloroperoxidase
MPTPVVFVHGLWLHSSSWDPWVELFNKNGYEAAAPGWPGDGATVEETRANADAVAGFGIDDLVAAYAKAIGALDDKPVVIGHSFGGLIAQRLLGEGHAVAAVGIDAAPPKGFASATFPILQLIAGLKLLPPSEAVTPAETTPPPEGCV